MSKREAKLYIEDIVRSIQNIKEYVAEMSYDDFCEDQKTFDAVIRNFEVMGEAAYKMPVDMKQQYPQVPWSDLSDMRNKLIHEYFGVDREIVWQTIQEDLPKLFSIIND